VLKIENIHTYYGNSYILQGISLHINRGEVVTLLGRNGMGKTTTLKSIMGLVKPREGKIIFKDTEMNELRPFEVARRGIGLIPEDRRIFASLSVDENLNLFVQKGSNGWGLDRIYQFFPGLKERTKHKGFELSGGEQQMLAIARILRMGKELMLLDEPTEGLAPLLVKAITEGLKEIKRDKITTLLVEQNTSFVTEVGDRHYILCHGKIVYEGDNEDFPKQEEVRKKYLGV
jgi:branched-chain amino acid transport system ATP-binding protein